MGNDYATMPPRAWRRSAVSICVACSIVIINDYVYIDPLLVFFCYFKSKHLVNSEHAYTKYSKITGQIDINTTYTERTIAAVPKTRVS